MRRKHLTFSLVFLFLCGFIALVSVSQQKSLRQLENEMETAYENLYNTAHGAWPRYKAKFDFYEGKIQTFITEHGKLTGIKLSPKLEWASAFVDGVDKNMTAYYLSDSLRTLLEEIEKAGNEASFFYIDVVLKAWYEYYDAVGAYNYRVSPEERISIQQPSEWAATPIYLCQGSCDARYETAGEAQISHQVYCPEKHGSSGTTDVPFYACSGSCGRAAEHWKECRASACSVLFPPPEHEHTYDYWDHKVKCTESVYDFWNPNAKCGEEYYTCEHSTCPDSSTHWSGSTPPTPSYHACGVHLTSVSGDHSLQASCSSTNSRGQSCTVTNFYACQSHTHVYPPPPPPPTEPRCPSGHTYDPNNSREVDSHTVLRTCRRRNCGQSWYRCVGKPASCKVSTKKCWAINP